MNRTDWLTDDLIEAAFEQRAGMAMTGDLGEQIASMTAATEQRSAWRVRLANARPEATGRPAWIALAVLAAIIGVVLALALSGHRRSEPFRTGLMAYVRNGDVYLARADGSDPEIALHQPGIAFSTVAWSHDGGRLAIDGDAGAIVLDLATGTPTFIGGGNPVWSPDDRALAVMDPATDTPARLRLVDPSTGATTTTYPFEAIGGLAWSPNGRWIAASGGSGAKSLIRIDVTTGQVVDLDGPTGHLDAPREVAWSPDSLQIAFIRWDLEGGASCPGMCETDVFVANADGSNATRLSIAAGQADQPSWSPDGQWIAIRQVVRAAQTSGNQTTVAATAAGIVIVHPDGTGQRALVADAVQAFAWGREGDRVRYSHDEGRYQPATLWETTLAGAQRALGVEIDTGDVPFERTGFGAAWQAVPVTASKAALPSISVATPAPTPAIVTPGPAAPADPSAAWPFLATDTNSSCQAVLVATSDGASTDVGKPCDDSELSEAVWSPNGTVFASIAGGRLSIVHRDGHTDVGVAGLSGLTSFSWSPKGTWLSVTGARTEILHVDGSGRAEVPGQEPYWSPDERFLAVGRPDGTLSVGRGDGSGLTVIGSFPAWVTWSPDGSRFAFARDGDVWTVARDGSDLQNVTSFALGGANGAYWSPDGQWLAVSGSHGVWVMRPDGSDQRWLDFGLTTSWYDAVWSPDSARLAVQVYADDASGQEGRIYLVNADRSTTIRIDGANTPSWSPDGRFLVVTHVTPIAPGGYDTGNFELMNADGSGRHELPTKAEGNTPVWVAKE